MKTALEILKETYEEHRNQHPEKNWMEWDEAQDDIAISVKAMEAYAAQFRPSDFAALNSPVNQTMREALSFTIRLLENGGYNKHYDLNKIYNKSKAALSSSDNEDGINKPKVVCFCGSTRFANTFMIERWKLEKQGIITLGINILPNGYFTGENHHGAEQEGVKHILDELHKRKIDLADEVVILNVGGYIGESTRAELDYALSIGKKVTYFEPLPAPPVNNTKK